MKKYILKFKGLFSLTCLLQIILSGASVGFALVLKYLVDLAGKRDLSKFLTGLLYFGIYCLILFIASLSLGIIKAIYSKNTMIYIKQDIFSKIMKKDLKSFSEENSANYISILSNDIAMIESDGIETIFLLINSIFSFVMALISIIYINIYITIAILILGAAAFFIPQLFSKNIANRRKTYSQSLENFTAKNKDILTGFEVIRNFNITDKVFQIYSDTNMNVETKRKDFRIYNRLVGSLGNFLGVLLYTVPIAIGGYLVLNGKTSLGTMIASIQLIGPIVDPIRSSSQIINTLKSLKPIFEKIDNLTNEDVKKEAQYSLDTFKNSIELKNLDFSYDGTKKALKNINQTFEKGKKYALVGGSGCGKSTLLRLLLRYYEEFDGNILIDGKEHRDIDINDIYKHLSVIQQNVFMFDGTVKDNIGLYGDYSDDQILKAAKMAGLSKLIESLPNGIYEDVGEDGSRLSGGEKQRVAIARALMKNSSIMLLDESTSALDNETAFSIEKSILEIKGLTSIVITHKLMEKILKKYDEIIVMRDGTIVERGEFNELISEKGYFYSLYNVGETLEDDNEKESLVG